MLGVIKDVGNKFVFVHVGWVICFLLCFFFDLLAYVVSG